MNDFLIDFLIGSDDEEKIVYSIIERAANKGIWIRDIRFQSNLSQTQLNKVLKNMESQKLIKSVKSVAASKKKVYMLNEIEPDRSVTGGSWYSGNDYESEFIEVLGQQCLRFLFEKVFIYLFSIIKLSVCFAQQSNSAKISQTNPVSRRNSSFVSSADVWKFIKDVGISKVELSLEDIESILDTLVFDGKVEKHITAQNNSDNSNKLYRSIESLATDTGIMRMPCGLCPVYNDCYEGGPICPSKCVYMKEWLEI